MKPVNFTVRNIVYQEKDDSFTAVCLDLDIIEEGFTTIELAILSLSEAVMSHFQVAKNKNFPPELTNRPAPQEYWEKLKEITKETPKPQELRPFKFFTTQQPSSVMYA